MDFEQVKSKIVPLLQENQVEYLGIFGSVARGDARPDSDVDILVKFVGHPTFDKYIALDDRIRAELAIDIDLVTEGAINKFLRPQIARDLKMVYGQRPDLLGGN